MVTVSFTEEEADRKDDDGRDRRRLRRICPLCRKELTNASGGMLARRCGHVVCKGCAGRFLGGADRDAHSHAAAHGERESVRCLVCNEELSGEGRKRSKDKDKGGGSGNGTAEGEKAAKPPLPWHGLIEIQSGGTGFSSAGQSEVKKTMTTFQC